MPESERPPRPSTDQPDPSPSVDGDAFRLAESLLAVGTESGADQGKDAALAIEYKQSDGPAKPTDLSAFRDKRKLAQDATDEESEDKIEDALEEKAIEEGVATANDTARIVRDLTSHNM